MKIKKIFLKKLQIQPVGSFQPNSQLCGLGWFELSFKNHKTQPNLTQPVFTPSGKGFL